MFVDKERGMSDLSPVHSGEKMGNVEESPETHDAVFGQITKDGPNYRSVRVTLRA
jgi:hypothetical protein